MIYFDNAASTFLCESAKNILQQDFGNPSSPHVLGIEAERAVKSAIKEMAAILSCEPEEIVYTSGGTESNNLGIIGAALALKSARGKDKNMRILATNQEHPSVTEPLEYLASLPGFSISCSEPEKWEICEDTAMVCMPHVSSETGDIFEMKEAPRLRGKVIVFVDGAQGFCKEKLPYADIYSFSGHKIHGPMGVGGLKIRKGLRLTPMLYGGGQQNRIRPGTENVPGILAMTAAAKQQMNADCVQIGNIKEILSSMAKELPEIYINKVNEKTSPYILNMSIKGIRGEVLANLLSSKGVCVSIGAACRTSKKKVPALADMGFSKERAESAIRLSFSRMNTEEEARRAKEIIKESILELRR